ncbi:MAG TPA: cupin domain-containing protein [Candidatus Bathyarchaeia archaeon]|nr:cupin domain-containing protein [Candidatus Bathyarchaeia archaeon]
MNSKVFELSKVLSELDGQGGYFIDFINRKSIQAGIIRLHPGEDDNQEPHSVDEVYYVIEGNGFIKLDGKDHQIRPGTSIFVPAKADHRFHGNKQDLVIFYALGGRS